MCHRYIDHLPLAHAQLGTWPATQAYTLTGNWTGDLLVCRLALNPLNHTSHGADVNFFTLKYTANFSIQVYQLILAKNKQWEQVYHILASSFSFLWLSNLNVMNDKAHLILIFILLITDKSKQFQLPLRYLLLLFWELLIYVIYLFFCQKISIIFNSLFYLLTFYKTYYC